MEEGAKAYYQNQKQNQVEVMVVSASSQNENEKSLKKKLQKFKVLSVVLLIALSLVLLTSIVVFKTGQPGCEKQKLLAFKPTVSTKTDLYSEEGDGDGSDSYDEEVLHKGRTRTSSKIQFKKRKISGLFLQAQLRTTVSSSSPQRRTTHRRQRRNQNPNAKMLCNTDIPSCLTQRKEIVAFSEEFDVELHYNGIHSKIIFLTCRTKNVLIFGQKAFKEFANLPSSCEQADLPPDTYKGNSDLPLKVNLKSEEHLSVLHDYLNMTNQFLKSLETMKQYFKTKPGQTQITDSLDVLLQRLSYLATKMRGLEQSFISCGKCANIKYKPTPRIMQFNSSQLLASIPSLPNVDREIIQSQYTVKVLFKFVQQMSKVFRRRERCLN